MNYFSPQIFKYVRMIIHSLGLFFCLVYFHQLLLLNCGREVRIKFSQEVGLGSNPYRVVVEKDLEPELKVLHPSVLVLNCFEFAMWITMTALAKESPCTVRSRGSSCLEEAVVKILPVYSHDSNFVHCLMYFYDFTDICQKLQWFPWHSGYDNKVLKR